MSKGKKTFAKICLILGIVPCLIKAYEYGPDPGAVAAPGDPYTTSCVSSGCHSGTPNSFTSGSVKIAVPAGNTGTYTPGVAMQIQVTVTDSSKAAYGFQLTARSGTGNLTQAGDFTNLDGKTQVLCSDNSTKDNGKACTKSPTQYAEQTLSGFQASQAATPKGSYTYSVQWTPPATSVGPVTLYAAAIAGVAGAGNVSPVDIFNSNIVLQPGAINPNTPTINAGGVVPIGSSSTTIQSGSWASIYGKGLATGTALWDGTFVTSLGGTTVTVNGKQAFLSIVSDGQINFQSPDDTTLGSVPVAVTNSNGTATSTVTLATYAPSFAMWPDGKHPAAILIRTDGSGAINKGTPSSYDFAGPSGTPLGFTTVAAKAGDILIVYGVGFGPTQAPASAGHNVPAPTLTASPVTFTIGGKTVVPDFAGLVSAGLYQFNMTVPAGLTAGDVAIAASVGGVAAPSGVVLAVQ